MQNRLLKIKDLTVDKILSIAVTLEFVKRVAKEIQVQQDELANVVKHAVFAKEKKNCKHKWAKN